MQFNVSRYTDEDVTNDLGAVVIPGIDVWSWALVKAGDEVICRSPGSFDSEKACRSHIAGAKKSMKGAMRCKVVTVDG